MNGRKDGPECLGADTNGSGHLANDSARLGSAVHGVAEVGWGAPASTAP